MSKYLYAAEILQGKIKVREIEIIKEAPKNYKIDRLGTANAYEYRTMIPKDHPSIALSKQEAIKVFIRNRSDKISDLEDQIGTLSTEIDKAIELRGTL